jgi:hypothetical protein
VVEPHRLRRSMSRILSPCFRRQLWLLLLVLGPLCAIVFFQIEIVLVGTIQSSTTTLTTLAISTTSTLATGTTTTTTPSNTTVDKKQQQFDVAVYGSKKQSKSSSSSSSSKNINIPQCGCPRGLYLTADERAQKEAILRTWCSWLGRQPGFGIGSFKSARGQRIHPQRARTWLYYEDPRWPKPKQCYAKGVSRVGEQGTNCACCYSSDSVYMTSIRGQVDIYHPSKTGSTTIIQTIKQQMNHSVKARVYWCERAEVPPKVKSSPPPPRNNKKIVTILSTRSPVERLISGVGELFTRGCPNRLWTNGSNSWNEVSQICKDNHGLLIRSSKEKLMECLIREHECHPGYCDSEHLFSHGFFVSRGGGGGGINNKNNYKDGPEIDALFRMENLTASLSTLPELLDHYTPSSVGPLNISTARSSRQKNPMIQEWQTVLSHLLTNNTEILQIVCRMYMQDFVCLDLSMPEECTLMLQKALVQG